MLGRYLILWLTCSSAIAYAWPRWSLTGHDPFLASKPALDYLIAATMFAIGSLLPRDEIQQVIRRWPTVLSGTAIQYTAMPLLAYTLGHLFRLEPPFMAGVIVVGCVPGAMASNVLTLLARGNVSYSISLTTCSTLLSPVVVPMALLLTLGSRHDLDYFKVFVQLLTTVVAPVLVGHQLCRRWAGFERFMKRLGPALANLAILWIIAVVVAVNRDKLPEAGGALVSALLAINLLGYTAGYFGATVLRLPESMRRALTLEIGMQNAGLGAVLAAAIFPEMPAAAMPPALYTFGCMLTGAGLASAWARLADCEKRAAEEAGDGQLISRR